MWSHYLYTMCNKDIWVVYCIEIKQTEILHLKETHYIHVHVYTMFRCNLYKQMCEQWTLVRHARFWHVDLKIIWCLVCCFSSYIYEYIYKHTHLKTPNSIKYSNRLLLSLNQTLSYVLCTNTYFSCQNNYTPEINMIFFVIHIKSYNLWSYTSMWISLLLLKSK